jgi:hypothetical protein
LAESLWGVSVFSQSESRIQEKVFELLLNSLPKKENTDFWLKIFLKRILFSQAGKIQPILPAG